ncbi:hypothetical protein B0T10DRAFT_410673 [Thelonectria olida]|uniref:Cyclin N-terminal domain-containing protein n=1 Tax=Thelonectria olida TaxID=1576542 RepID=A0A9P8W053_9HYPO|nr:hypothetical protein B0T10DRAFT_410673 [Thelonectria olida]
MNSLRTGSVELDAVALRELNRQPVNQDMISYVSSFAAMVFQCNPSSGTAPESHPVNNVPLMPLEDFVVVLIRASKLRVITLMGALLYLIRLKSKLRPGAKGGYTTNHRIFLASIILATKYLDDNALLNYHWAFICSTAAKGQSVSFSLGEINLMEMQLLDFLGWELCITPKDLYIVSEPFLAPIRVTIQKFQAWKVLGRSTYPCTPYSIQR